MVSLIKDLNGNHVVQRCLQRLGPEDSQFIYDAAVGHNGYTKYFRCTLYNFFMMLYLLYLRSCGKLRSVQHDILDDFCATCAAEPTRSMLS